MEKSDEQVGKTIAGWFDKQLEARGIRNVLVKATERGAMRDRFMDSAVDHSDITELAFALALDGDFARAGRAFKRAAAPQQLAIATEKYRLAKIALTKATKSESLREQWFAAADKIRDSQAWPCTDSELAKMVARKVGGKPNTIRLLLPKWGLGKKAVEKKRRAEKAVKSKLRRNRPKKSNRRQRL
jgi:hypothetical protein